jgi:hypothetical protein
VQFFNRKLIINPAALILIMLPVLFICFSEILPLNKIGSPKSLEENKKLKVKSAEDIGPQFKNNNQEMIGQDGAYSFPINEQETFWFFGDTFIGERTPGESLWYPGGKPVGPNDMSGLGGIKKMINNTGLILKENSGKNGLNNFDYITDAQGNIKPLIELLPDEHHDEIRIWCLHGITIDEKIYLFFIKVKMIEEGIFPVNFELLGSGIAVGKIGEWKFERIVHEGSDLLWKENHPKFAAAVLNDMNSGWLYLYGVVQEEFVQNCSVARVKPDEIHNLKAYQYYSGNESWSKNIDERITIFTGMPNELSVSYNNYLKSYLAVHSHDLTGNIVARTSPTPWGPWSEPTILWTVKAEREQELPYPVLIYAGKEHPALSDDDGKIIYLTYIEFEEYYPHLIKVELE